MEAAVNCLPDEILEVIFSYCTHSELVQSIQNVCCRWREVVQSTRLWKHVTYRPEYNTRSEEIVEMLKISPKLQNIILGYGYDGRVLQALTDNCVELRKIEITPVPGVDMNFIKNLQEKCPEVEYLNIPYPCVYSHTCEMVGIFTNLKVLHLNGDEEIVFQVILKPVADYCKKLQHLELEENAFKMNDLRYLLTMRKDTLHTLGVSCCDIFGECVLPAVSTCELKSLSLFRFSQCKGHYMKVEHFPRLKVIRALSIRSFYSVEDIKQILKSENMAQLLELSLQSSYDFHDDIAEVIIRNCPLIKCLSLKNCRNMSDATLKTITDLKVLNSLTITGKCRVTDSGLFHLQNIRDLKHLTIMSCDLGLGNITKLRTLLSLTLMFEDLAEFPWDQIPHHMQYLQCLHIYYCENVDTCAVEKLKTERPSLRVKVIK